VITNLLLAAALAAAGFTAQAVAPDPVSPAAQPAAVVVPDRKPIILPKGTMVRLMVLSEVNSRDHKVGHRFVLRVDEDVTVGGVPVIRAGAKGWGEVVSVQTTGGAGKRGRLNARLLYLEADGRRIGLEGERQAAGSGATGDVVTSVVAFGPFGLLMKGKNATLKAGEILNGYTTDEIDFAKTPAAS
jgi:hypothetical protein